MATDHFGSPMVFDSLAALLASIDRGEATHVIAMIDNDNISIQIAGEPWDVLYSAHPNDMLQELFAAVHIPAEPV